MIIYTAGYNNWTDDSFKEITDELNAVVIDIRYSANAFLPFWTKKYLQKMFGDRYKHIPQLGNKNYRYRGFQIEIDDINKCNIVIDLMRSGTNCILLCACVDYEKCHRKIVAEEIQKRIQCEIKELEDNEISLS